MEVLDRLYPFHLTPEQEVQAARLHEESIIIDMLFQGPLSPGVISDEVSAQIKAACAPYLDDPMTYSSMPAKLLKRLATEGALPAFKDEWYRSGITAGNRELELSDEQSIITSMAEVQHQFDSFDWLFKARTAKDIYTAKQQNVKAGIVTAQDTVGLGKNLALLDALYDFGLRVLQLTYNTQNHVGAGVAEKSNAGVTNFGVAFIERLNELGILVDTGHCGKQTTLDACRYSKAPVIASHTGVEAIYPHMRCKSDEEIKAIASTGGVVGVFAMPWFIHSDPNQTTLHHLLDHVEYIIQLVGINHVGIGTDWPMSDVLWSLVYFKEHVAYRLGFEKGTGPSTETVAGLERYGDFINVTRGLMARGYTDEEIKQVLGGNWLRVFAAVCG